MRFGGNIGEVMESLFCIASSERHTKRHDGEEQKDEPPMNGALNTKSLKERIETNDNLRAMREIIPGQTEQRWIIQWVWVAEG